MVTSPRGKTLKISCRPSMGQYCHGGRMDVEVAMLLQPDKAIGLYVKPEIPYHGTMVSCAKCQLCSTTPVCGTTPDYNKRDSIS